MDEEIEDVNLDDESKDLIDEDLYDKSKDLIKDEVEVKSFEDLLIDKLNDEEFKNSLILKISPELPELKRELELIKEKQINDKEKQDFKDDPDSTLQNAKLKVKESLDKEWGIKLSHTEELLKIANDTIASYITKENEAILGGQISDSLSEYSIRDGADKDIIDILKSKFFVNDEKKVVSLTDGVESVINIKEFVREFFKERPYFLNEKRGSGTFNNSDTTSKTSLSGFERVDRMFE